MQTSDIDTEKQPLLGSQSNHLDNEISINNPHTYTSISDVDVSENDSSKTSDSEEFSFRALDRRKKVIFLIIGMVNFCACTCFSLLAPFYPAEAAKKGVSTTVVGLIFSCFEFWIFITAPIFGYFLTRIGAKFMFISGILVCGTCSVLFGILDKCPPNGIFIAMCFASRTVEALGCSAFITASFAIIAHEFPNNVATVFGSLETFSGIGMMVGPPIGGALYELGGYGLPFWTMGAILITCGCVSFIFMPGQDEGAKAFKGSVLRLLTSPLVVVCCLTVFCGSFSLGFLDPTLANHLEVFNLSSLYIGLIFLCAPGVYGFTAPIWGYLGDAKDWTAGMMIIGLFFSGIAYLLLGPAPFLPFLPFNLWLTIVTLCCFGLFIGCCLIPTFTGILTGAKQLGLDESLDTFGMVSGLFNSSFSLGAFVGPSIGGLLQDHFGFGWAASSCGFLYLATTLVVILFKFTSKQGFNKPPTG
ncbi:MFS-type transporter SLC18B1 isoform X1 [Patella vulgata]|uniref:MFS-type transporter SLC18B1 isoform X1 n=2 Tax=Patella vulgata TaxID=6465 RepID=UPI0024A8D990|nr:MFS-type transporter SLC18B1 isoform X1 [Patella vulgata]XP_055955227.1 MFS-type transporter SLC18B1 isoform X1 [Patella vulgata]